jgi:DNA-binding winged helix-turn-helix (wHTH) protein
MSDEVILGSWRVSFEGGWIRRQGLFSKAPFSKRCYPDRRLMTVLRSLSDNAGQLVTTEELLDQAWSDRVVSRDSVTTAIYQLRQLLGDNKEKSSYIRSEARRGYRLVAPVRPARTTPRAQIAISAVSLLLFAALALAMTSNPFGDEKRYLVVEPLVDMSDQLEMSALFEAIDATLFSQLIAQAPAYVVSNIANHEDALRMQSALVACDLGPALIVRILDAKNDVYFWSKAYNLHDAELDTEGPTLVEHVADEVAEALYAYQK